jgi:hypothetical protein
MTKTVVTTSRSWLAVNPSSFFNSCPMSPDKSGVYHLLVFSGLWVKGGLQMESLTQMFIELAGTLIWLLEDF